MAEEKNIIEANENRTPTEKKNSWQKENLIRLAINIPKSCKEDLVACAYDWAKRNEDRLNIKVSAGNKGLTQFIIEAIDEKLEKENYELRLGSKRKEEES